MVGSDTRNAWAISAVVRPQTSRRVSATCASLASAGWQQVKTSRSLSSGITSSTACPPAALPPPAAGSPTPCGGSGSISSGSFARSVRPRPRHRRCVPGGSPARCVHHRAHLDAAVRRGAELGDLQGVVKIPGLDQVGAAERLLGLSERPVRDDVVADRRGGGRGLQRVAADNPAAPLAYLAREAVMCLHGRLPHLGRCGHVGVFVLVDEDHVLSHASLPRCPGLRASPASTGPAYLRRTVPPESTARLPGFRRLGRSLPAGC